MGLTVRRHVEVERQDRIFESVRKEPDGAAAEVRERLRISPGDRLRYILEADGVRIENASPREEDDPSARSPNGPARLTTKRMATSSPPTYRAGDVIVVPFPYSDRFAQKRRPALVVSNDSLHALGLVRAVMITSAKNSSQSDDMAIVDLVRAGLSARSVIRPTKIACRARAHSACGGNPERGLKPRRHVPGSAVFYRVDAGIRAERRTEAPIPGADATQTDFHPLCYVGCCLGCW